MLRTNKMSAFFFLLLIILWNKYRVARQKSPNWLKELGVHGATNPSKHPPVATLFGLDIHIPSDVFTCTSHCVSLISGSWSPPTAPHLFLFFFLQKHAPQRSLQSPHGLFTRSETQWHNSSSVCDSEMSALRARRRDV